MRVQKLDNKSVGVFFNYSPELVTLLKSIPGRQYEPRLRAWLLPIDGLLDGNLDRLAQAGFDVSAVRRPLTPQAQPTPVLDHPIASSQGQHVQQGQHPIFSHLRPYQHTKALQAISLRGGLIRGFCGCGKTIISLATLTALSSNTNLIVCPKSVLFNWEREIKQWLPGTSTFVVSGTKPKRRKIYDSFRPTQGTKFLITTYDCLRTDFETYHAINWHGIVLDEVHYLVNTTSLRHKAAVKLRAEFKYGLSATPIMNSALDIYGCCKAVGKDLGNYFLFQQRYCQKDQWGSVKYFTHMDELKQRISPWIIPIDLEEAQFQLPSRTDTDLIFELSAQEASLYNRIRSELLFELEQAEVSKLSSPVILQNTLVKLGKLQELTDSCELLGDNIQSTKLDVLKEHLKDNLNENKAIIFTRFERMAQIMGRELSLYNPIILTGATENRQELIDAFKNNPTHKVFISTEAGNSGINLEAANIVYNYDLPFSLGKLEQRQGRIRWHTQDKPVFFYNLIATLPNGKKTIDSFVKEKIIKKQGISDQLLLSDVKGILI